MRKRIWFLSLFAAIVVPTVAGAEERYLSCPKKPAGEAGARKSAGALFSEAEASFDAGLYVKSLEQFLCSMKMVEHPNTVINIEKTLGKIQSPAVALPLLEEYVSSEPEGELTESIAVIVERLQAQTARAVSETAERCPEAPPPACPESEPCAPGDEGLDFTQRVLFLTGWVDVSVGAAAFVTAIVLQGVAGAQKNRAEEATSYHAFLDAKDKHGSFQIAAATMFVTAAVLAGTGIVHLIMLNESEKRFGKKPEASAAPKDKADGDEERRGSKPRVTLVPGPTWFGIEGTF